MLRWIEEDSQIREESEWTRVHQTTPLLVCIATNQDTQSTKIEWCWKQYRQFPKCVVHSTCPEGKRMGMKKDLLIWWSPKLFLTHMIWCLKCACLSKSNTCLLPKKRCNVFRFQLEFFSLLLSHKQYKMNQCSPLITSW